MASTVSVTDGGVLLMLAKMHRLLTNPQPVMAAIRRKR